MHLLDSTRASRRQADSHAPAVGDSSATSRTMSCRFEISGLSAHTGEFLMRGSFPCALITIPSHSCYVCGSILPFRLLAMGVDVLNTDWRAIHERFLPPKTPHQVMKCLRLTTIRMIATQCLRENLL